MLEQDIELARLLLEKQAELEARNAGLREQLEHAQAELSEAERVRSERDTYLQVLSRAATLLDRPDLQVDLPATDDLEESVRALEDQLSQLNEEVAEYQQLVEDLRSRAPHLLSAASGEPGGSEANTQFTEDVGLDDEPVSSEHATVQTSDAQAETEELAGSLSAVPGEQTWDDADEAAAADVEQEAPPAFETEVQEEEEDTPKPSENEVRAIADLEDIFILKELKVKEAFTLGRGAAYIIDATSVLDRVPRYDMQFRALSETEVRDELIRDIDRLSSELSGDFYIVFNSWHQPLVQYGNCVEVSHVTGDSEGTKPPADQQIRDLITSLSEQNRAVCLVTGDSALADSVTDENVAVLTLGGFFNT